MVGRWWNTLAAGNCLPTRLENGAAVKGRGYSEDMTAWPLFDLRIKTPQLTLRLSYDAELMGLAEKAAGRVLPAEKADFMGPWTQLPSPEFERSFMQYHWLTRADWKPESWTLNLGVYPEDRDEPVGIMGIVGKGFVELRSVSTGSWLLPEWCGKGLGREARAAVLHLAFAGDRKSVV